MTDIKRDRASEAADDGEGKDTGVDDDAPIFSLADGSYHMTRRYGGKDDKADEIEGPAGEGALIRRPEGGALIKRSDAGRVAGQSSGSRFWARNLHESLIWERSRSCSPGRPSVSRSGRLRGVRCERDVGPERIGGWARRGG